MEIKNVEDYNWVVDNLQEGRWKDRPDVERAVAQEAQAWHNAYRQQQAENKLEAVRSMVDTTPIPFETPPAQQYNTPSSQRRLNTPDRQEEVGLVQDFSQRGIDAVSGLDKNVRAVAGLVSMEPESHMAAMDALARRRLDEAGIPWPEDVPVVFPDEKTGKPLFMQPVQTESGEWKVRPTLTNPPGMDMGDFASQSGNILQAAMETAGGAAGGAAGAIGGGIGVTMGAAGGSAVAASTAIAIRKALARELGIPEEALDDIDKSTYTREMLFAAGGDMMVGTFYGAYRKMANQFARPLDMTDDEIAEAAANAARELVSPAALEAKYGLKFRFSAGQVSGLPELLVAGGNLKRQATGTLSERLAIDELRNRQGAIRVLDLINERYVPLGPPARSSADIGEDVVRAARTNVDDAIARTDVATQRLYQELEDIPLLPNATNYDEMLTEMATRRELFERGEEAAWNNFRSLIGFEPSAGGSRLVVDNGVGSNTRRAINRLSVESNQALNAHSQAATRKFMKDLGVDPENMGKARPANDSGTFLTQDTLDFHQAHRLLSDLKREQRRLARGRSTSGWEKNELNSVITALESDLLGRNVGWIEGTMSGVEGATRKPRWYDPNNATDMKHRDAVRGAYIQATDITAKKHQTLVSDNINAWIQTPRGRTGLARELFQPGKAGPLNEAMTAVGNNIRVRQAMQEELLSMYRRQVKPTASGEFNMGAHVQFLADYGDHLRVLLGDVKPRQLLNFTNLSAAMQTQARRADRLMSTLRSTVGRPLANGELGDSGIAGILMSGSTKPSQARAIMQAAQGVPGLADDVRRLVRDKVYEGITSGKVNDVSFTSLDKMLRNKGHQLRAVMGNEYVNDLSLLRDTTRIFSQSALEASSKLQAQPGWVQLSRSLLGPLSKPQRFITASLRVGREYRGHVLRELLTNPERLRQFVRLKELDPTSFAYVQSVMDLGLVDFADEQTQERAYILSARQQKQSGIRTRDVIR